MDLGDPHLYLNRELSWLSFNRRVVALARREDVPCLERLKFIAIAASNLDEFYMVRMGGLERSSTLAEARTTRLSSMEDRTDLLLRAGEAARALSLDIARCLLEEVGPSLAQRGIEIAPEASELLEHFQRDVHPCLTPIAVDTAHPFPLLKSGSLNLAFRLRGAAPGLDPRSLFAVVQVPSVLPRFLRQRSEGTIRFVALEDIIARYADQLFPGHEVLEAAPFRLTRASDLDLAEEEAEDLLSSIEDELRRRDRGEPVRLELEARASEALAEALRAAIGLEERQVVRTPALVKLSDLWEVVRATEAPEISDPPFQPVPAPRLRYAPTMFRSIDEGDVLLHHPYDSFRHVIDFLEQAAGDPDVVAIKQTLYRTSGDSPVVRALARAAEAGKDVTALVELKARFDEANNIAWARELERSGVHVVYGLIGLKTHCKMLLVTRRSGPRLRRYLHLGTGNYNPTTARLYTDIGLFTSNDAVTHDAMQLFNVLTGYAELPAMAHLVVAPFGLREHILERIEAEIGHARAGRPAGLVAQMNSLVDRRVIEALYRASRAGVSIDLMVRGICCLRPGLEGVSERIRVHSVLDRFLEHSRIFWWKNGGEDLLYSGSADWMPRNLDRRIEVVFPILDPEAKERVTQEVLGTLFSDDTFAWELGPDGSYRRRASSAGVRAQAVLIERARQRQGKTKHVRPEVPAKRFWSPARRATEDRP